LKFGLHLPLMEFGGEGLSLARLAGATEAARDRGFSSISANDHFLFATPWLDGPTALAAVIERSGQMRIGTTIALASLRGPVSLAKTLAALDILSGGRLDAGVGPGSSKADYDALGVPFEDRWPRFDEAVRILRSLIGPKGVEGGSLRYFAMPDEELSPPPRQRDGIPIWIGSWGSAAGIRRVARLGDGWLASAYNTTPEDFAVAKDSLAAEARDAGRKEELPNALSTMWTWVTEDRAEADRVLAEILAPLLRRDPEELRGQVCVGSAEHCAELLSRFAEAGCERVYIWPLGDEVRQVELFAERVAPEIMSPV
jgi:alkanesulfonate monooxygenase SsuD/methylene tetrahydromethanopterin reductase-like flavin-dependent oxidoreductase (luciferase family)